MIKLKRVESSWQRVERAHEPRVFCSVLCLDQHGVPTNSPSTTRITGRVGPDPPTTGSGPARRGLKTFHTTGYPVGMTHFYIYISILKHQFQQSSCITFLQITPHIYFKLTRCTPVPSAQPTSTSQNTPPHIDGQTAARHGSNARRLQLWPRHGTRPADYAGPGR